MASDEVLSELSATWNPSLRPDGDQTPAATDLVDFTALDSKGPDLAIEAPTPVPDEQPVSTTETIEPVTGSDAEIAPMEVLAEHRPSLTGLNESPLPSPHEDESLATKLEELQESMEVAPSVDDTGAHVTHATHITEPVATEAVSTEDLNVAVHVAEEHGDNVGLHVPDPEDPFVKFEQQKAEQAEAEQQPDVFDSTAWMDEAESGENPATTNGEVDDEGQNFWDNAEEGRTADADEEGFFDQLKSQTKPIFPPPEPESRYEEGVPLLDETPLQSPVEPTVQPGSNIGQIFDGDDDEEDPFFADVQKPEPVKGHALHLTRKSTSQVMDSLGPIPDSPASDGSPATEDFNALLAAPAENQVERVSSDEDLAARWQAELATDQTKEEEPVDDDLAARWQAELDDDDDLLLEDEGGEDSAANQFQDTNGAIGNVAPVSLNSPFANPEKPTLHHAAYTPHQPSTSDLLQGGHMPGATSQTHAAQPTSYFPPQPPLNRPVADRAESFAERSKEGYKSPYDLPDDLARPRRTVTSYKPTVPSPGNVQPPPPRSSSIPGPPPPMPMAPTSQPSGPPPSTAPVSATPKNFYEDLPLPPTRSRSSRPTSSGQYAPNPNAGVAAPPHATPHAPPPPLANPYANLSPAPQPAENVYSQPQIQQPEQPNSYGNSLAPSAPAGPPAASRYSPKPPGFQAGTKPPPSPRYSPVPPQPSGPNLYVSHPPGVPVPPHGASLPYQPRTSSPLAYHEKSPHHPEAPERKRSLEPSVNLSPPGSSHSRQSIDQFSPKAQRPANDTADYGVGMGVAGQDMPLAASQQQTSPPRDPYAPPSYINEFSKRLAPVVNDPQAPPPMDVQPAPAARDSHFSPPRRSYTQSPGQQMPGPRLSIQSIDPFQRPASVHGSASPTKAANPYAPSQGAVQNRVPSQQLDFMPPTDGQQLDTLERWKGAPIVKFGFGGAITSCFPRHIPRYMAGQATPLIKPGPGEVKICQINDWMPPAEGIVQHPGPLKSKSKKKDLLAWLSGKIAAFENEGISEAAQSHPDAHKRHDEKILLWKIVRILVEGDGTLEGSSEAQKSLRGVIFPHLESSASDPLYGGDSAPSSTFPPLNAPSQPDTVDAQSIESLRNSLLMGDREKAVWGAADSRLWGHAMIIASTLDKSVWKQVVQEFVRREVRSAAGNTESLAALYEIFAGNIEESIDELVPPSARAGLQMISKADGQGVAKNALDGLESWRETLGLVLINRSAEDYQALLALGRLLASYGRVEAAHACFIFSRAVVFGGADDQQTNVVLLGADHQRFPSTSLHDEDAILLTEAYEYATSVLAGQTTAALPHLLAFKLLYASSIAERGRNSEALQYCDAIAAALKASSRPSPYYNQHLFSGVDELSARLRQSTTDAGSWISKPSMEKVSGSMWARFNSFVAGDDSDAASTGSGKGGEPDVGPFAKVSGTPTVSRSPSVSDMYGYPPAPPPQPIPAGGASKYHPSSQYAPHSSSPEQMRGRSSLDSQRSASHGYPGGQRRGSQEPSTPIDTGAYQGGPYFSSPSATGYQSTPPQSSYMPLAPVEEDLAPQSQYQPPPVPAPESTVNEPAYHPSMYTPDTFGQPLYNQGSPAMPQSDNLGYMPPGAAAGYMPPGVVDTMPDVEVHDESVPEEPKKNKSFMDDDEDDDMASRAAAIQKAERARKDREADEAFKKAAEADAQKPAAAKKGWFGGWFGGAKKEDANPGGGGGGGGGPIRAKLGEENSFYYDKELKKWVNKKDPNSATPVRGTPPPPRGLAPPTRSVSSTSVPPSGLGSAAGSRPASSAGPPSQSSASPAPSSSLGVPHPPMPRSVSTGGAFPTPPGSSGGGPPPPRPATSLSHASSIDDLLGAPQARKGGAAKGKKKGRYVDVMAK